MKRLLVGLTALAATLAPSNAQTFEPVGEITMSFGGKEMRFHTLVHEQDATRDSTATVGSLELPFPKGSQMLMITGVQNIEGSGDALHLALGFKDHPVDGKKVALIDQPEITMYERIQEPPYWASVSSEITFSRYEFDGKSGHASGTFSARLCLIREWDEEPDMASCQGATGEFDTQLLPAY